jgi:hypothetical protein
MSAHPWLCVFAGFLFGNAWMWDRARDIDRARELAASKGLAS